MAMRLSDQGSGVLAFSVLGFYYAGDPAIWRLYAVQALTASLDAFQGPAYSAASTLLLSKEWYGRAGGLRSMATDGARVLALFLAGYLFPVLRDVETELPADYHHGDLSLKRPAG